MTQTHALIDDQTTIRCLPGAARLLAISAAYLAVKPAAVSSKASNGHAPWTKLSAPRVATETTGTRL